MIKANRLTLTGRLEALSARFAPGTITAICGPNGAGKSTLLQCLAGLIAPERGDVIVFIHPLNIVNKLKLPTTQFKPITGCWDISSTEIRDKR